MKRSTAKYRTMDGRNSVEVSEIKRIERERRDRRGERGERLNA